MKKIFILFVLCFASCEDSYRVSNFTPKHGAVPLINPARTNTVSVEKDSITAFLVLYIPILLGISFLTWKMFRKPKSDSIE